MSGASCNQACSIFRYASLISDKFVAFAADAHSAACCWQYDFRSLVRSVGHDSFGIVVSTGVISLRIEESFRQLGRTPSPLRLKGKPSAKPSSITRRMRFIIHAQFRRLAFCPGCEGVIVDGVGCGCGAHKVFAAGAQPAEIGPYIRQFKRIYARPFIKVAPRSGTIDFAVVRNGFLGAAPTLRKPPTDLIPFPERALIGKLVKIQRRAPN